MPWRDRLPLCPFPVFASPGNPRSSAAPGPANVLISTWEGWAPNLPACPTEVSSSKCTDQTHGTNNFPFRRWQNLAHSAKDCIQKPASSILIDRSEIQMQMSENQMKGANLYSCTEELQTGYSQCFINFSYFKASLTAEFRRCSGVMRNSEQVSGGSSEPWGWLEP